MATTIRSQDTLWYKGVRIQDSLEVPNKGELIDKLVDLTSWDQYTPRLVDDVLNLIDQKDIYDMSELRQALQPQMPMQVMS